MNKKSLEEFKELVGDDYDFIVSKIKKVNEKMKEYIDDGGFVWDEESKTFIQAYAGVLPSYTNKLITIGYADHPFIEQLIEVSTDECTAVAYSFEELGLNDCIKDLYKDVKEIGTKNMRNYDDNV